MENFEPNESLKRAIKAHNELIQNTTINDDQLVEVFKKYERKKSYRWWKFWRWLDNMGNIWE